MEEELYGDDTINSTLDMPLYSPLPHLQYQGHAPQYVTTPLEDWIKQPNNLTLSSDALMASLNATEMSSNPATPTSIFCDQALPSFAQTHAHAHAQGPEGVYMTSQGFSLPPFENTLDFDNDDLGDLP
jgi:hypothetical protein